eukprot:scaffold158214_cov31-Tisochrysis_lutea.AAC.2
MRKDHGEKKKVRGRSSGQGRWETGRGAGSLSAPRGKQPPRAFTLMCAAGPGIRKDAERIFMPLSPASVARLAPRASPLLRLETPSFFRPPAPDEDPEEEENKKEIRALDEGDIALLKTYVSRPCIRRHASAADTARRSPGDDARAGWGRRCLGGPGGSSVV